MRKEIRLMVGVPGSGKSTLVEKQMKEVEKEGLCAVIVSRDNIRKELTNGATGEQYFSKEKKVFNEFVNKVNEAIKYSQDVIFVDATHINEASRHKILSKLNNIENYVLVVETIKIPVEIAIERNNKREGFAQVPESAIRRMYDNFEAPLMVEFEKYNFRSIHLVNFYE